MVDDLDRERQRIRQLPAEQRAWVLDLLDPLDAEMTPRREQEEQSRHYAYAILYRELKQVAEELGQPIRADHAEWLVRWHPAMPSPFSGPPFRTTSRLVKHPPAVIQQHFKRAFSESARKTLTMQALRSIEEFEKLAAQASTHPLAFDALHDAAMFTAYPQPAVVRSLPTMEHLRRWQSAVETKRLTPPPRPTGPDPFKNLPRNLFFWNIVETLRAFGLSKLRNEATEGVTSACDVVAQVYGVSPSTVRTAFDQVKKLRA